MSKFVIKLMACLNFNILIILYNFIINFIKFGWDLLLIYQVENNWMINKIILTVVNIWYTYK